MKTVVFVGPSLSVKEARSILPHAIYLPPARQADLVSAVITHAPDAVGLIDGEFGDVPSVWHKEVLFALQRGVRMYGAASMGALRAAELAPFGMIGVGDVFHKFSSGELEDDDEVAVVHASAESNFVQLTEPMVNLRATLECACAQSVLSPVQMTQLVAAAKSLHFTQRTLPALLNTAQQFLPADRLEEVRSFFATGYVDVKRKDARRLLEILASLDVLEDGQHPAVPLSWSPGFSTLYEEDRTVPHDGADVTLRSIAVHAALHVPDFDELNFAALNRALIDVLADLLHVQPTDEDIEAEFERFRGRLLLEDEPALNGWLHANDLDRAALRSLMCNLARCRRLQRWLLAFRGDVRQTRWLLDELRLAGRYQESARGAAIQTRVLATWQPIDEIDGAGLDLPVLIAHHAQTTGWRLDIPATVWSDEAGFDNLGDMAMELLRVRRARERLLSAARLLVGPPTNPGSGAA